MEKNEIFKVLNENPVFFLATSENDQPRVRGMMLFKADEKGIVFHTGAYKDLYTQLKNNPKAELCFFDMKNNVQIRVSGALEETNDSSLKEEILAHPSREFLRQMRQMAGAENFDKTFAVFALKNAKAVVWTFQTNLQPKTEIPL
ncbi:MAG: pyridoxamine 5'-phosphate oxidase family protein [Endomicrobia bacterium]|nr:pyridoxamine 5'-phosphate oxidase family protein [Endomicrobiia bacterium]MCL2506958.1 pyridoxamine 5'-phosphate oxidase family protein [Endomicrobiia bacterium]